MEPPSNLLWRLTIPAVLHVAVVISRTLLQPEKMILILTPKNIWRWLAAQECMGTLTAELDNMDRMLMQTELTVIAGDQESYSISGTANRRTIKEGNYQWNSKWNMVNFCPKGWQTHSAIYFASYLFDRNIYIELVIP